MNRQSLVRSLSQHTLQHAPCGAALAARAAPLPAALTARQPPRALPEPRRCRCRWPPALPWVARCHLRPRSCRRRRPLRNEQRSHVLIHRADCRDAPHAQHKASISCTCKWRQHIHTHAYMRGCIYRRICACGAHAYLVLWPLQACAAQRGSRGTFARPASGHAAARAPCGVIVGCAHCGCSTFQVEGLA
jgi:hypothetical protein